LLPFRTYDNVKGASTPRGSHPWSTLVHALVH
jgi:hypothetical protein